MAEPRGERHLAVRLLSPALRYTDHLGLDAAPTLEGLGLPENLLADPDHQLSDSQFDALLGALRDLSGDPDFGIHAGEHLRPGDYGLLEALIGQAESDHDITDLVNRFHGLLGSPGRPPLQHSDDSVTYLSSDPAKPIGRTAGEYAMVAGLAMARLILGRFNIVSVAEFSHAEPENLTEHHRVFSAELRFNAERNALTFPLDAMPVADLRAVDRSLSDWLIEEATNRLTRLYGEASATTRTREVLLAASGDGFSEKTVAYQLAISPRTLRRQLAADDTTFSDVRDTIRHKEAARLLRETDRSLLDIALHLGFGDSSGLHRAFKRWEQMTPTEYRTQQT